MRASRGAAAPLLPLLLLLSGAGRAGGSEDIVVGCGGFVKSDVEINYSLIEVRRRAWRAGCVTPGQALGGSAPFPSRAEGRGRRGPARPRLPQTRTPEPQIRPTHIVEPGNHTCHSPACEPQGSDPSFLHPSRGAFEEDRFPWLSPDMEQ